MRLGLWRRHRPTALLALAGVALAGLALADLAVVGVGASLQRRMDGGPEVQSQLPAPFPGMLDEHPRIQYAQRAPSDRIAALNRALADTRRALRHDARTGYLVPVLDALGVAPESQLLVFSKTGVQRAHTSPANPRALFFNESVAVGYIPGAPALELAVHDREQGVVFYTLDQSPAATPSFTRQTSCLTCHVSASTLEVPGLIVRSHVVDRDGARLPREGVTAVNHTTPHPQRWGGWFVTGNVAAPPYQPMGHLGNLTAVPDPIAEPDRPTSGPAIVSNHVFVQWLDSNPQARGYLSPLSDLAALLVFDHQAHAVNLITHLGWEARVAGDAGTGALPAALRERVHELADYLLFVGEATPVVEVTPRPGFAEHLTARTPKDRRGRSLGELDLVTRLMRYPCSYMVYSEAFDGLPAPVKRAVYRRLWEILTGKVTGPRYAHLSGATRRAIRQILRDTKADLDATLRAAPRS